MIQNSGSGVNIFFSSLFMSIGQSSVPVDKQHLSAKVKLMTEVSLSAVCAVCAVCADMITVVYSFSTMIRSTITHSYKTWLSKGFQGEILQHKKGEELLLF